MARGAETLPRFRTDRLELRPRGPADFAACLAMDRDPEVTRHVPGPWADPRAHEAFLRQRMATDWGRGLGYWSIFARAQPERFLGWVFLIPAGGGGPELEIGWRLVRAAWGNGYAAEAAAPVLNHAFREPGAARVVAEIHRDNIASLRVALGIGMRPVEDGRQDGPFELYALQAGEVRPRAGRRPG